MVKASTSSSPPTRRVTVASLPSPTGTWTGASATVTSSTRAPCSVAKAGWGPIASSVPRAAVSPASATKRGTRGMTPGKLPAVVRLVPSGHQQDDDAHGEQSGADGQAPDEGRGEAALGVLGAGARVEQGRPGLGRSRDRPGDHRREGGGD